VIESINNKSYFAGWATFVIVCGRITMVGEQISCLILCALRKYGTLLDLGSKECRLVCHQVDGSYGLSTAISHQASRLDGLGLMLK
jgi:hypothetical protein